jgi:large subunit ribosomal protein L11
LFTLKIKDMAKKVKAVVKINLKAAEATPAPPVGTALGQHGIAIMDFVKEYNDRTRDMKGEIVPVVITIYEDRSFDFVTKKAPVSDMIKKAIGIENGSGKMPAEIVGTITRDQVRKIAEDKLSDLNTKNIEAAVKIVEGTARSMGVKIE